MILQINLTNMENDEIRIIGIWNEIKADRHNHVDLVKNALDK